MKSEIDANLTHTQAIISIANHMVAACGMAGETILAECELIEKFDKFDSWSEQFREALSTVAVSSVLAMLAQMAVFYTGVLSEPPDHADDDAVAIARGIVAKIGTFLVSIEEKYGSILGKDKSSQIAEYLIQFAEESMQVLQSWLGPPQHTHDKVHLN